MRIRHHLGNRIAVGKGRLAPCQTVTHADSRLRVGLPVDAKAITLPDQSGIPGSGLHDKLQISTDSGSHTFPALGNEIPRGSCRMHVHSTQHSPQQASLAENHPHRHHHRQALGSPARQDHQRRVATRERTSDESSGKPGITCPSQHCAIPERKREPQIGRGHREWRSDQGQHTQEGLRHNDGQRPAANGWRLRQRLKKSWVRCLPRQPCAAWSSWP